eukprot:18564-Heterococcus_DN1.PRE.2
MDDAYIGHHGVAILSCIQGFRHCHSSRQAQRTRYSTCTTTNTTMTTYAAVKPVTHSASACTRKLAPYYRCTTHWLSQHKLGVAVALRTGYIAPCVYSARIGSACTDVRSSCPSSSTSELNITREMDDACIGHHGVAILSCIQGFRHCDIESHALLLNKLLVKITSI